MDTNVLPNETQGLHTELTEAARKVAKRDDRAEALTGFGATTEGMTLTKTYLNQVTQAVTEKLSGPRSQTHSAEFKLERLLRQLDPQVLALCLLQAGLHAAGREGASQVTVADVIGESINDELWAAKLLHSDAKRARRIMKQAEERFGSVKLRRDFVKREAAKATDDTDGFQMQDWGSKLCVRAGNWGMDVLLKAMPLVFQLEDPRHFKGDKIWSITEFGLDMAKAALAEVVCMNPVYQPRTERPKDWDKFVMRVAEDDRTMDRAQLMRTRHKDIISAAGHAIRSGQMAPAIKALNTLQSVPFVINTWIMDVMVECYNNNIAVDGLPSWRKLEVPKKVPAEQWREMPVEQRRLLAKVRKGRQKANRANDADVMSFEEDMGIVARLAVAEQFYTPMNMDWRSRVYALTHFNFQREDRVRALFLFSNGEPIGEEGIYWLKLHVANCGAFEKVDKKPFEERVKWVDENLQLITDYVKRPLYNTGWTKADSPFLFLAAARELIAALDFGPAYVCSLPVSWDGACNGLQHLCAMTRAPEGRYVNLTSDPTPHDVYQYVADIAKQLIEDDLNSEELFGKADDNKPERKTVMPLKKLARIALAYGVDRKLVKRNVMTFSYSSKEFGMSEQQFEDTMEPLELKWLKGEIEEHPFGETEDEWKLFSRYLAKRVLKAIKTVVKGPAEAMEFMQALAKKLAHEGKPLRWTSPAGVPCVNRYHAVTTERIKLFCYSNGVKVRSDITVATGYEARIDKEKSAAGIAANFTHSHDAAHLLLSVAAAADEGITDIATVHDSFGCLPSRAGRFNQIIREQFLKMYEHDVLAHLLASAKADLTEANHDKLPELPDVGTLDLKEILNAKYAFA
jgi:DNA-directed RNA polymerase, mitochondrial